MYLETDKCELLSSCFYYFFCLLSFEIALKVCLGVMRRLSDRLLTLIVCSERPKKAASSLVTEVPLVKSN